MEYSVGSRIGDYEILAILGAGGMGKVYKVRNLISDRVEAMKVLLTNVSGEQDQADRFMREIKVQARLAHRNIAGLHTALHVNNQLLMLMEYVEGTTLERLLKVGPVPARKAVELMCQVLDALGYAHAQGVIHRDLKPSNIMMTVDGVVKLLDFGIAKLKQDQSLTRTGFTVGSLPYMSPEQIEGSTTLDQRADVYALGISLYEIVTGQRPFQGDSDYSLMVAHLKQIPVPPIQIDPRLPQALNDVILTAIEKDREQRFQSAAAMLRALQTVLEDREQGLGWETAAAASSGAGGVPGVVPSGTYGSMPAARPGTAAGLGSVTGSSPVAGPVGATAPVPSPVAGASAFMATPSFAAPAPEFPSPAVPPPTAGVPASKPHGNRGLYITLGSFVTVVVLVIGAVQIPKIFRTQAGSVEEKAPSSAQPGTPNGGAGGSGNTAAAGAAQPAGSGQGAVPAAGSPTGPASGSVSGPAAGQALGARQPTASITPSSSVQPSGGGAAAGIKPRTEPIRSLPSGAAAQSAGPAGGSSQAGYGGSPQGAYEGQAPAGSTNAANHAPEAALRELREHLMLLGTRANSVKSSLERLKQEQARQGLGLRGDMNTAAQRMEFYLDECESAIKRGDAAGGKKYLDLGEREVSKLEGFLGR